MREAGTAMPQVFRESLPMLRGLGKVGGWFAVTRLAQVAASVWVTRELSPGDFAVMTVIAAIQGTINQITSFNLGSELVRARTLMARSLTVSWTYELARSVLLCFLLLALAPVLAGWMGMPTAAAPLRLTAIALLPVGLRNPRLIELRREGRFGLLGWIECFPGLIYAVSSIVFVYLEPSFWALVWAGLASGIAAFAQSYSLLPWRPALDFHWPTARPMFAFGLILSFTSLLSSVRSHGIVFLLTALGFRNELGYYNRATAFSWALALQAISILWKVSYPLFSQQEIAGTSCFRQAGRVQLFLLVLSLPLAGMAIFLGPTLIPWILDSRWRPIIPLWCWLVLASVFAIANSPYEAGMQASRHERVGLWIYFAITVLQFGLAAILLPRLGLPAVGIACMVAMLASLFAFRLYALVFVRSPMGPGSTQVDSETQLRP